MLREWVTKFALGMGLLVACSSSWATVFFNVNSVLDEVDNDVTDALCLTASGTCTLRAAIMQANHINLPVSVSVPAGTYLITLPAVNALLGPEEQTGGFDVLLSTDLKIRGAGSASTIIDGNSIDTVFTVFGKLELDNVTIRGGYGSDLLYGNTEYHVHGALQSEGDMSLNDSIVRDNLSQFCCLNGDGALTITRTVIESNNGGYAAVCGEATIIDSTIAGNSGNGFTGEGTIIGSTIANNGHGGIFAADNLVVVNSTITGNSAASGAGIYYDGSTSGTAANVYNSTIAFNDADTGPGGGVYVSSGSFNIYNTLIAGNTNSAIIPDDCSGPIFSHANNLLGTTSGCAITKINASQYGLLNSLDYLGPLADNGGPTQTIALLDGSNAIDGGPSVGCFDRNSQIITEDQRGFPRPLGARCDIGAFESGDAIFRNGFE